VHENGVTSFNFARRQDGINARTSSMTHTQTLSLLRDFFSLVNGSEVQIMTPFLFNTKADIFRTLRTHNRQNLIPSAVSCSKTFQNRKQAREFAESTLDSFSHDYLNELAYLGEPIFHLYHSLNEETAIIKIWEVCNRHGAEVKNALKRIQVLHDEPYHQRQKDSLLAIIAEQSYLKDPVSRLIEAVCNRLTKAIPTLFQHNPPANEPDLNDKIQSFIEADRADYEREYPGIRFALATTISDHSFGGDLFIETKYIRGQTTPSKAYESIAADITKYGSHGYTTLFVIYDPDRAIKDDGKFSGDFEKMGKCEVRIFR
jgi:hypothetical protein